MEPWEIKEKVNFGRLKERPRIREGSHIYPIKVNEWPIPIGKESQLFVDDFMIHSMENLKRTLHQPEKYKGNPILKPEHSWEGTACMANGTIIIDPITNELRMYYKGWGGDLVKEQQSSGKEVTAVRSPTCLAVSKNGIDWIKPKLGILEYKGSKENNIVIPDKYHGDLSSFIYDEKEIDSNKKWKAAVYQHAPPNFNGSPGLYAYFSPDGLNWTKYPTRIMAGGNKSIQWPLDGIGDVSTIIYDRKIQKFVAHVKLKDMSGGRNYRARGRSESNDFIHWSRPIATLIPDELDPLDLQMYGMTGWPYESMWLGTLRCYHSSSTTCVDFQLISSRDGIHWERAANREVFIPNGPLGSYDYGYHTDFSNAPIRMGNELWFYYGSTEFGKNKRPMRGGICLAKLRLDGFVSLDAGEKEAFVLTRPIDFEGNQLIVNANAKNGCLKVEIQEFINEKTSKTLEGFSIKDCLGLKNDSTQYKIKWIKHEDLSTIKGKTIQLRFQYSNAELYSFSIA